MSRLTWFLFGVLVVSFCEVSQGDDGVLDSFGYADTFAVRAAWDIKKSAGVPASVEHLLTVVPTDQRNAVRVELPFGDHSKWKRIYIDRKGKFDLLAPSRFSLEIEKEGSPKAFDVVTIHFHSEDGWYWARGKRVSPESNRYIFEKSTLKKSDRPGSWDKIDTIRLSFWQGDNQNGAVRIKNLTAIIEKIVVILTDSDRPGAKENRRYAKTMVKQLDALGLHVDQLRESELSDEMLRERELVILPCNASLPSKAEQAIIRFINQGGKVFIAHHMSGALGDAIGIEPSRYRRQKRPGQFAEIRFDEEVLKKVDALPSSVRQASWNLNTARPITGKSNIWGAWFDDKGNPTGQAGLIVSDQGAFLTHVILEDDREAKQQLLAALIGKLYPEAWRQMAQFELKRAACVGPFHAPEKIAKMIERSKIDQADELAKRTRDDFAKVDELFNSKEYVEAIRAAREAHRHLTEAYLSSVSSRPAEGRAFWNHSGTGAYPGDWDRTIRELAEGGFNMVLPNMLWGGVAHYPSEVLPQSGTFDRYGDQVAACVKAGNKYGVEVHVWKVNWVLGGAPEDFVEKLRGDARLQKSVEGCEVKWLCPSHPANFDMERRAMLEVVQKYPVDGIHFDYIRYDSPEYCFCDGCRARFEVETGKKVENWPTDCYTGCRFKEYSDWRRKQISRLVETVSREAKQIRPEVKVSAAVFQKYPACRDEVFQDWVAWVKAGYLDFACPMDYLTDDSRFEQWVQKQLKLVEGRIPLYPGIGVYLLPGADRVVGQIEIARRLGADGFTLFNLTEKTASELVPAIKMGAGRQKASPPH
jgi:uncharacterized lipoprotein YddW (UPF0748 family)